MLQVLHPTCPKISNFRNVGIVKSHIQNVSYQIIPHSRQLIYLLHLYENPPACIPAKPVFWYLQFFPVYIWLNFEYWITCQLCRFRCKSATVYVLINFSNLHADWYFSWLYLNFHWLIFCGVPSRCIFFFALQIKTPRKKADKKCSPKLSQKISIHNLDFQGEMQFLLPRYLLQKNQMIRINSCLWESFPWVLLVRDNLILDFLFYYDLSL